MAESSEASEITGQETPEACPPTLPYMQGWLLYWMAIATFGIYLPFWVYRFARATAGPDRERGRAVAWALGSLAPPVCWALLREFHGAALAAIGEDARKPRWWVGFPAALYLALLIIGGVSPLRHFVLTPLFLLPLPFVLVQRAANRAVVTTAGAATTEAVASEASTTTTAATTATATTEAANTAITAVATPPRRTPRWQWVVAPIGTILVAFVVWLEAPGFAQRLRPLQAEGANVAAVADAFRLTIPGKGWRRLAPGTLGQEDSALELSGPGAETWLVAYTMPSTDTNLHATVDHRRTMIFADGEPRGFDERRFFLEGSDLVPVSVASYEISYGLGLEGVHFILTAETDEQVVEVLAYTAEADEHLEAVKELVLSFAIPAADPEVDNES